MKVGDVLRRQHIEGEATVVAVGPYEVCIQNETGHLHTIKLWEANSRSKVKQTLVQPVDLIVQ